MEIIDSINKFLEDKRQLKLQKKAEREYEIENMRHGNLPIVSNPNLVLQQGEVCHYAGNATYARSEIQTVGRTAGYSGVSVKVAKGVTLHTGGARSHAIKEEVPVNDFGTLFITNKRIIFMGDKHFNITYGKVLGFNPLRNGFELQTEKSGYLLSVRDSIYVNAALSSAINLYTGTLIPEPYCKSISDIQSEIISHKKSKSVAFILCLIFGIFGVHRFYVGKKLSGVLYLCTLGLLGIGWVLDLILITSNRFRDVNYQFLE